MQEKDPTGTAGSANPKGKTSVINLGTQQFWAQRQELAQVLESCAWVFHAGCLQAAAVIW